MKEPILVYPDPSLPYILYTDASKYAWACVLTQPCIIEEGQKKEDVKNHPITHVSGLFKGSQINWAALAKEAYAIYMSVKKLNYYLEDANIILMSDHLPLKKFLKRNTLNVKVNNWAIELSSHKIDFRYIKGIKNTLADTMSRLVQIDPEIKLPEEEEGKEYGYAVFESLPPLLTKNELNSLIQGRVTYENLQSLDQGPTNLKTNVTSTSQDAGTTQEKDEPIFLPGEEIKIPIEDEKLIQMQRKR